MRHRKLRGRLGRNSAHRRAMIDNMITSLFAHERIRTTVAKAKAARRVAERMITLAKRGTLHTRRLAFRRIRDNEVLQKLFAVLGPRYENRPGGYTRIVRIAPRRGDGAERAILELVDRFGTTAPTTEEKPKGETRKKGQAAATADVAEEAPPVDEAVEAGPEGETGEVEGAKAESAGTESEAPAAESAASDESVEEEPESKSDK